MTERSDFTQYGWNFDHSYARLPDKFYTIIQPTPVTSPNIIIFNKTLALTLGLNPTTLNSREGAQIFAGNQIPEEAYPLAQAYAGHQFGYFTMLGDGRAHLLGEQITPQGERYDIQLKGSGETPYSRRGDGRAALGPMLREYIISEAMAGLGIPTTRSLAVVTTGEPVFRETILPGAILTRVASSHIRVGTFQYIAKWGTKEELQILADYTIQRHFAYISEDKNKYLLFLKEVIKRQAELIGKWMLVGFIHGVMNTDNMVLSGETIDYGPCAFLDIYNPATVFSSIDKGGRYAFGNQPNIGAWNLARLAETLLPLLHPKEGEAIDIAQDAVAKFDPQFQTIWLEGMRAKLGLSNEETEDDAFIKKLLTMMEKNKADYTNTFRSLSLNQPQETQMYETNEFRDWYLQWQKRLDRQPGEKETFFQIMRDNNPAVIPRNYRVEEALKAAVEEEDYSVMERLIKVLKNPYAYIAEQEEYAKVPENSSCGYKTFCGT